jgi:hypothetical protein
MHTARLENGPWPAFADQTHEYSRGTQRGTPQRELTGYCDDGTVAVQESPIRPTRTENTMGAPSGRIRSERKRRILSCVRATVTLHVIIPLSNRRRCEHSRVPAQGARELSIVQSRQRCGRVPAQTWGRPLGRQCRIRCRCGHTPKRLPAAQAYARAFARASKCARVRSCVVMGFILICTQKYTELASLLSLGVSRCEYVKRRFMRVRKCVCACVFGRSGDRACTCACVHVARAMDVA